MPGGYRFHDLRHYYASALIASGLAIKTVQIRMRHASGKTTIDTYGHMFPDTENATRVAISIVMATHVAGSGRSAVGLGPQGIVRPSQTPVQPHTS